jgi:hypothetical protein
VCRGRFNLRGLHKRVCGANNAFLSHNNAFLGMKNALFSVRNEFIENALLE